jgi:transketolase
MSPDELKQKAYQIRKDILEIVYSAKAGHIGGDMSETDILTVLIYNIMCHDADDPNWEFRDRFILSKGHSFEAYLAILADHGYFAKEELKTYSCFGSKYIGHPNNKVNGIEVNTGSLGHGLAIGVGMALASKMDGKDSRVFVLMGDGEIEEGSVWEAAMAAAKYKLDNLTAILDRNGLQISGSTENVMPLEPLKAKWESFGFKAIEIDGHDYTQIERALRTVAESKPSIVIANTVKGKGISFMENTAKWHHGVPDNEQFDAAMQELDRMGQL